MKVLFLFVLAAIALARADKDDDFLAEVQRRIPNNSWKAKKINLEHEKKTRRLGWLKKETKSPLRSGINLKEIEDNYDPPASFDAREKWDNCRNIGKIWNQAACGSCWAFATATSMTDRLCIHKKETYFPVSPEDVLSCCTTSAWIVFEEQCGDCENGGFLEDALDYFVNKGVCSGGTFGENDTCKPYSIDPSLTDLQPTPKCQESCTDKSYSVSYENDRKKGSEGHYAVNGGETFIMEEIEKNGPVSTGFIVYEDFMAYDSGIYQHSYGEQVGGHAVKIIGWGTENGIDYWLIVNSWSESWGEGGTFKFLRGVNHCDIENNVVTALP